VIRTLATSILREPAIRTLGGRGRETGVNKLHHATDRKSVRVQDAFGAAIIAGREQFKRADAVGLDVTSVASGRRRLVFPIWAWRENTGLALPERPTSRHQKQEKSNA
jgi:hypothetical protein